MPHFPLTILLYEVKKIGRRAPELEKQLRTLKRKNTVVKIGKFYPSHKSKSEINVLMHSVPDKSQLQKCFASAGSPKELCKHSGITDTWQSGMESDSQVPSTGL